VILRRAGVRLAVLLLASVFWPGLAWASIPKLADLTSSPGLEDLALPQLPLRLDQLASKRNERAACGSFCAEPLRLELTPPPLFGRSRDPWRVFSLGQGEDDASSLSCAEGDAFLGGGLFGGEGGLGICKYANANPTRFIDPTGHASRVIETDPRRTGFTVTPEGYTQALTYETTVTVTDDQPAAYALPQTVGRQVAPLNKAAETGVRVTGVALQATAAATLAAVPEPTGLTKAGAVYFGARALDEGQALTRELATGTPTASFAHQGVSSLYEATGDDPRTASFKASLTLAGADLTVGLGAGVSAVRAGRTSGAIEGTVVESPSQVPASGSTQLRVLNPHFTPTDPTRVLQNITTAHADALGANPALAQRFLSRPEYLAGQRSAAVARLNMGKAVERSVADEISQFQPHRQLFDYASGPNRPDFTGVPGGPAAGMNFDITTPGQVGAHLARPGYGPGLNVVTYQRPPLFTLFP
jgi:F0F1-type ATP synthase membrane subunit c/vacuolar-type H+-ATPase subunit K